LNQPNQELHSLNQKITLTKDALNSLLSNHKIEPHIVLLELIDALKRKIQALKIEDQSNPIIQGRIKLLNHSIYHLREAAREHLRQV